MTLTFTYPFDSPYYTGLAGTNADVPGKWDISLGGRTYMLDQSHPAFGGVSAYLSRMGIETIPLIRQQADSSTEPGESTINPEDLWPRAQSSWHKGAGQRYLDSPTGDRNRFHSSLGITPWTRNRLDLLNDVANVYPSVNTNLKTLRSATYLYIADGTDLQWSTTPYSSWTSAVPQAGESATNVLSLCSDGSTVYVALGTNGIHTTVNGASSSTHYSDLQATLVSYVKGRLMAVLGASIYNVVASGAAPAALYTSPNASFTWVGFAEGLNNIYAAGFSGDKSLIYRTTVKTDGTALDAPIVAGELPDGEIVRSIQGYLGFVVVGTDLGFRLGQQDSNGNLTFGAIVPTTSPVRCFEPQDHFVWFGDENYDSIHTGLGRMDLTEQTDAGAPAWATDLMAPGNGHITSVATNAEGGRAFMVNGVGLFVETLGTQVASGTIDSGLISYGIPDPKIALRIAIKHKPLATGATVAVSITPDDGAVVNIGTSNVVGTSSPLFRLAIPEVSAQLFEVHFELDGGATLESYELRAYPSSSKGRTISVPILLYEEVETATGSKEAVAVRDEYDILESYVGAQQLITYQELAEVFSVFVEDTNFQRHHPTSDRTWWNGTHVLKLKVLGD